LSDPFAVLGLTRTATIDEIRAARRRLAFEHHPDRGGDDTTMQAINAAFEVAVAHATGRRPLPDTAPAHAPATGSATTRAPRRQRPTWQPRRGVEHDAPSFVIEALPVEAYEALLLVTSWIGEVLIDEPPYLLEVHLHDPAPCWCRLELVPDAGASTVSLTVAPVEGVGVGAPPAEQVRDTWVACLNAL
jgi:hypothetical protein